MPQEDERGPVTISSLQLENVKRIKAIALKPTPTGLTVIGGRNDQGKTSVLDAIAWALGGERFRPSEPKREGSVTPPYLHVTLSNGLVVERKGRTSELKVVDPEGVRAGQMLLNSFIEQLALDLPRFLDSSAKDKAQILLEIIGVKDELESLDKDETRLYDERTGVGRLRDQKQGAADEMDYVEGAPEEEVSALDLIQRQQAILVKNGENLRLRQRRDKLREELTRVTHDVTELSELLAVTKGKEATLEVEFNTASKSAAQLEDESTSEIERSLSEIEKTNATVRTNASKRQVQAEADGLSSEYERLTSAIEGIRAQKMALLKDAELPLAGLGIEDGELTYNGRKWDAMSSSEQLKVATAIVRCLKPECGFLLMDKLEQMDTRTLEDFAQWVKAQGLQIIATRVSQGDECSVIIEDGYAIEESMGWKKGEL